MKFMDKNNVATLCDELSKNHAQGQTELADGSVTTTKLASKSVTRAKLGDASVGTDQLGASSVTTAKVGDGQITEDKLATAVKNKLNSDNNTTYQLSKSGNTITLTGSDGSTSSVTDEVGSGGTADGNTTYALSKSGGNIILTGSDGSTSQVADSHLSEEVYNVNLNSEGYFSNYIRGIKSGGVVVLSTDYNCEVVTPYPHQQYVKIGSVPSGWEPAYTVTTCGMVADKITAVRVNTAGEILIYTDDPEHATIPVDWNLNFSISYRT